MTVNLGQIQAKTKEWPPPFLSFRDGGVRAKLLGLRLMVGM